MVEVGTIVRRHPVATPLLVAAAARVLFAFVLLGSLSNGDDKAYIAQAITLLHRWPGPAYFWPVGTSLYLVPWFWAFGSALVVSRIAMIVVAVLNVGLTGRLATDLFGTRVGRVSLWLAALWPSGLSFAGHADTSELEALTLLLAAVLAVRAWREAWVWWIPTGVALGAAMLVRANAASVLAVASVALVLVAVRRRRWGLAAAAATIVVVAFAVVAPVGAHHVALGEGPVLGTNAEDNLFLGNNRFTPLYRTDWMSTHAEPPAQAGYVHRIENSSRSVQLDEVRRYVARHPVDTTLRVVNRARAFWGFDYDQGVALFATSRVGGVLLTGFEAAGYAALAGLAIVGVSAAWAERRRSAMCLLGLCVAYQLPFLVVFAAGLYHFPVMYFLMPLSAVGWLHLRTVGRAALRAPWVRVALAVFVLVQLEYAYFAAVGYR